MNLDVKSLVTGLVLGASVVFAVSLYPVHQLVMERDFARLETKKANESAAASEQKAATYLAGYEQHSQEEVECKATLRQYIQGGGATQTSATQDPAVQLLNAVRPGLGTAAAALQKQIQAQQQNKTYSCPAGYALARDAQTQQYICVLQGAPQ